MKDLAELVIKGHADELKHEAHAKLTPAQREMLRRMSLRFDAAQDMIYAQGAFDDPAHNESRELVAWWPVEELAMRFGVTTSTP